MKNFTEQIKSNFLDHPVISSAMIYLVYFGICKGLSFLCMSVMNEEIAFEIKSVLLTVIPAALIAVLMKKILGPDFLFGIRFQKMGTCLVCGWRFIVMSLIPVASWFVIPNFLSQITFTAVMTSLLTALMAGTAEEIMFRGLFANNAMRVWGSRTGGIWQAVLLSSLLFGFTHSVNALSDGISTGILLQMFYSAGMALVFAAAYLRSRNLLGCMILHTVLDFVNLIQFSAVQSSSSGQVEAVLQESVTFDQLISKTVLVLICTALTAFLLRKKKQPEIQANWGFEQTEV